MNISSAARLASLILLIGSTSACITPFLRFQKPPNERRNSLEEARRILDKEKREDEKMARKFIPRRFDPTTETGKVIKDAFEALNTENFQRLEQEAGKAGKEKTRLAGGYWKIRNIYHGLSSPINDTDEEWTKHLERLNRWKEQFPQSITARVALAESWISYAWEARGDGYVNTVSAAEWRLFEERLNFAEKELLEAKNLEERCPQLYSSMLVLARAQGRDLAEYDAIYRQAIKFDPHYYPYALQKATYLLPRWHGEPGDWEAFVNQVSGEFGGTEGLIIYYLIVSDYIRDYKDPVYDKSKLSMEKAKQGFYALKKTYGADRQTLNEFAKFACRINDFPAADEAFEEIGDDWMEGVWNSREMFDRYKNLSHTVKTDSDKLQKRQ